MKTRSSLLTQISGLFLERDICGGVGLNSDNRVKYLTEVYLGVISYHLLPSIVRNNFSVFNLTPALHRHPSTGKK